MSRDPHPVDPSRGGSGKNDNPDDYLKGREAGKQGGGKDPWTDKGSKKYADTGEAKIGSVYLFALVFVWYVIAAPLNGWWPW